MGLPEGPVTLTAEQVAELNKKLAAMRHDVNNYLSMVMTAAELLRIKPDLAEKMLPRLLDQPLKISNAIKDFSTDFEKLLGLKQL